MRALLVVVVAVAMSACRTDRQPESQSPSLQTWRKLAEFGYPPAQFEMGNLYNTGEEVNCDLVVAANWYRRAAEQGYAPAQVELAWAYFHGQGVPRDYLMAAVWLRIAGFSKCGGDQDRRKLLRVQLHGTPGLTSSQVYYLSVNDFDDLIAAESKRVALWPGVCEGEFKPETFFAVLFLVETVNRQAFARKSKLAELGFPQAEFELGECYQYGIGVRENIHEAIVWYTKAAEQEHLAAQLELAKIHRVAGLESRNVPESIKWYLRAAQRGEPEAQYELARCYESGVGVSKDQVRAVEWCARAAEQGHPAAEFMLAECYADGAGLPKDEERALTWYRRAAWHGDSEAQRRLGMKLALDMSSSWEERIEGGALYNLGQRTMIYKGDLLSYVLYKAKQFRPEGVEGMDLLEYEARVEARSRFLYDEIYRKKL